MHKYISSGTLFIFSVFLFFCSDHNKVHWSYDGEEGPDHWGTLSKDYSACKDGQFQSPVNIAENSEDISQDRGDLSPVFHYSPSAFSEIDNTHTIQANLFGKNSIEEDGKEYLLKQIHFHSPSENQLNGRTYPLEAHLVHKAEDGSLAVVAVFFNAKSDATANAELDKIWSHIPGEQEKDIAVPDTELDLSGILPEDKTMFRFDGSLTTPPCSEGVTWNVFRSVVLLPESQIIAFQKHYDHNARPLQDLHHRKIIRTAAR